VETKVIEESLQEKRDGIILTSLQAKSIYNNKKELIIKADFNKKNINKVLYLLDDNHCYGLIKLRFPEKIDVIQFKELSSKHLIDEEERKRRWPRKEVYHAYRFDVVKMFENPKPIEVEVQYDSFVQQFNFLPNSELPQWIHEEPGDMKIIKLAQTLTENSEIVPMFPMKVSKEIILKNKDYKCIMEKKYIGLRVMLYKSGNKIKLFSDKKEDISNQYPSIVSEAMFLSDLNYILDGVLVTTQKPKLQVFDIIELGNEDVSNLPLFERKSKLHSLRFINNIKEVMSIVVNSNTDYDKTINFFSGMSDSAGTVIKNYMGSYIKDGESTDWIVKNNEATTTGSPGISDIAGKIWKKKIDGPKKLEDMTNQEKEEHLEAVKSLESEATP